MALTIHLGAHKTASTHLQQTLRASAEPMRRAGVHYLGPMHLRQGSGRLDRALGGGAAARDSLKRWRDHFDMVADIWPELLLSDENLLGSLRRRRLLGAAGVYPQAESRLERLCSAMRHRPATICLAVREPLSFLRSAFAMQVEGGIERDFTSFLDGFDPAALSWADLAERLLTVEGVARLIVWRYEDYRSQRETILRLMLPDAVAARAPRLRAAVVGMSQAAFDELRRRLEAEPDADPVALAREVKGMFPRSRSAGPVQVGDRATARRTSEAYRADLDRLVRMSGVRLLTG